MTDGVCACVPTPRARTQALLPPAGRVPALQAGSSQAGPGVSPVLGEGDGGRGERSGRPPVTAAPAEPGPAGTPDSLCPDPPREADSRRSAPDSHCGRSRAGGGWRGGATWPALAGFGQHLACSAGSRTRTLLKGASRAPPAHWLALPGALPPSTKPRSAGRGRGLPGHLSLSPCRGRCLCFPVP